MKRNNEWIEKAELEMQPFINKIFFRFWQELFGRIYQAHSYRDEFVLESCIVDYDYLKNFFQIELQKLSEQFKKKFSQSEETKAGIYFCLEFQLE